MKDNQGVWMRNVLLLLSVCLAAAAAGAAEADGRMGLNFEPDGTALLDNSLLHLRVTPKPGRDEGIRGWFFKPTGYEMVDVLYRQLDAGGGHLLGMIWDGTAIGDVPAGAPRIGARFVPRIAEVSADGRAVILRQITQDAYSLTRTLILRRDHGVVEVRLELANRSADPVGFALRFHNVQSPGARGQYAARDDRIAVVSPAAPLLWEQGLPLDTFQAKYGSGVALFDGYNREPPNMWTRRPTNAVARLARPFAAQFNPENGDGLVFIGDPASLLGFYNCPGITLEPVFRPASLARGEVWRTSAFLGAFGGVGAGPLHDATPLYVVLEPPALRDGRLQGRLVPLFSGRLQVSDAAGKIVQELPADVLKPVALAAPTGAGWHLIALDRDGAEIGRADDAGRVTLFEPKLVEPVRTRPQVSGPVYAPPGEAEAVKAFVAARDFVVQCDWTVSERVRELARETALRLGVGLAWTPRYAGKMIAFGSPGRSATVRNLGLIKNSLDDEWPGAGRGVILHYANNEASGAPALVVGGSDPDGAYRAAMQFFETYVKPEPPARGFDLWVKPLAAIGMIWDRPRTSEATNRIVLHAARGEYECAQVMLTAYEPLSGIETALDPLIHEETGAEISKKYLTLARRRHGPLLLRWAAPFPLVEYEGWPGVADGLLQRGNTTQEAGASQVLWLTAMVSKEAAAGRYRSTLRVSANGKTNAVPIELMVHDFALPDTGLQGAAYMAMNLMAEDGSVRAAHVDRLVSTLVEHRFRKITLSDPGLLRYQISTNNLFKGINTPSLIANEDGTLLLDSSRFDWLVDRSDQAAKPFEISFTVPFLHVIGWNDGKVTEFSRAFPDRFAGRPPRDGHPMRGYWAEEMAVLFRRHLERRGLMKRVKVKVGDEPPGFDFWWENHALAAREAGLPFTTAFNSIDWPQARKALGTTFVDFEPLYQRFDPAFAAEAQAAGHAVGWYNCGPPPRIGVGTPPSELRSYYWQAAKYNLDFVARWGVQCWGTEGTTPNNVWTFRYAHHNSMLYPEHPDKPGFTSEGRGWVDVSPIESIRFNLVRDGIEDADYVRVLRAMIAQARQAGLAAEADRADAVLDAVWLDVFPSLNHYNPPYAELMARRKQVAQAILGLQDALAVQVPEAGR